MENETDKLVTAQRRLREQGKSAAYARGYADAMETAANMAEASDSKRGNEMEIATALRAEAERVRREK